MRDLLRKEKDFLFEILLKGSKGKSKGYIRFRYKNKNYKRSQIIYQIYHNIKLSRFDIIHHIDGNKENDKITNLKLMTSEEHTSLHHAGKKKPRKKKRNI